MTSSSFEGGRSRVSAFGVRGSGDEGVSRPPLRSPPVFVAATLGLVMESSALPNYRPLGSCGVLEL
jgi:hypothetical protein